MVQFVYAKEHMGLKVKQINQIYKISNMVKHGFICNYRPYESNYDYVNSTAESILAACMTMLRWQFMRKSYLWYSLTKTKQSDLST